MTIDIHFTESDWQRIAQNWNAWWAGKIDRPMIVIETTDPALEADRSTLSKFGLDTPVDTIIDNWQRVLESTRWYGDAFPKWFVNYGPGAISAFLGCDVTWRPDTSWFSPLPNINSLSDIKIKFNPDNPWWKRVKETTKRAVERWGDKVLVSIADIGCNLDLLASLRGTENLLYDLNDDSQQVERIRKEITSLWPRYYDELYAITSSVGRGNGNWGPCWSSGKGYMLQCDMSYMISPQMYKQFVVPDLTACCAHLDYGFYHLDGKGQIPHVDHLISIERLRGIQWIAGDGQPPAEDWIPLLKKIRDGGKLCQVYVSADGARKIIRELGGKGFVFYVCEGNITPEKANELFNEIVNDCL